MRDFYRRHPEIASRPRFHRILRATCIKTLNQPPRGLNELPAPQRLDGQVNKTDDATALPGYTAAELSIPMARVPACAGGRITAGRSIGWG
jgi:hypothetical protein